MSFKPISDSVFIAVNSTLNFHLDISSEKKMDLECSIVKVGEAWQVQAQIAYFISLKPTQSTQKFECSLDSVYLEPMETRTIGAWKEVFLRSNGDQWSLSALVLEGNREVYINPVESFAKYANQNLLEITAYENGVSIKSDYLTLKV